jgi:hypothetical protein
MINSSTGPGLSGGLCWWAAATKNKATDTDWSLRAAGPDLTSHSISPRRFWISAVLLNSLETRFEIIIKLFSKRVPKYFKNISQN